MPENENEKNNGIQALISLTIVGLLIWALLWSWGEVISEIDKSGGLKCVLSEFWENGTGKNCGGKEPRRIITHARKPTI